MTSLDFLVLHPYWAAISLALLPAALHWWWTRWVFEPSASAVLPERHLAIAQRVSFVTTMCTVAIIVSAGWRAVWVLPLQFVALTFTTYRSRRPIFGETWPFYRYLSWRLRIHVGMFGLWWFVAFAPALVAQAEPTARWWLAAGLVAIAASWHHWSGRVLLVLLGATPLARPDLDPHFQRVFAAARVPTPTLWRAGAAGGVLANAFAMLTLSRRGVLFFDTLLEQLSAEEITAILAHEVAHLEQFTRRKVLGAYLATTVLMLLLMIGTAIAAVVAPGFQSWVWVLSAVAAFVAIWVRAHRMQAFETDADRRAIELCGDPEALIRALTRIYAINHIPRRWSVQFEERATHPSLARRIRAIRALSGTTAAQSGPIERLVVASSDAGRCALIDGQRVGFVWIDGDVAVSESVLDRANRVEMVTYDQLSELRLASMRGTMHLTAVDRQGRRSSMPIQDADAARVQAMLDQVDHLVVAPATPDLSVARRAAVLVVLVLAAPYSAIGAVLAPALLALRRPKRPIMIALAAALAGTAIASVNERGVSVVRITLLTGLAVMVLLSVRRRPQDEPPPDTRQWTVLEHIGLLIPVLIGLAFAAANGRDLFGVHSALRDRAWFTAALGAVAVFCFVQSGTRISRRVGLGVAVLATLSLVAGSPWFLLHAVADPFVAAMPSFSERTVPALTLAERSVDGEFSAVRVTPDGRHFVLFGQYDAATIEGEDEGDSTPRPPRFIAGGFDGWSREIRAFDVATIDDERLLVLDRAQGSSHLRAEELRSGRSIWTIALPNSDVFTVQAASDGRWRAFARRGNHFDRIEGRVGATQVTSIGWTVITDKRSYLDIPRNDGGSVALAVAPLWEEPTLTSLFADWRETTRLLRVDSTRTTELATSHLRVECPAPPIGVTGYVCVSFDGRSSRFWRVDLSSGERHPLGETPHIIWKPWQSSQHRLAAVADGRPVLVELDSRTLTTLNPDKRCWTQDIGVAGDVIVAACSNGGATIVTQYRLPAERH